MADVHGSESGNAHTHTHSDNCEEELSAKYAEYVEEHLEELRTECKKINTCVDELLADENIITIINGYDLNIKKTCSLVYQSGSETVRNSTKRCTPKDRQHIHSDFEDHLTYQLETDTPAWKNVSKCLEKNYGNSITTATNVEKICGLAYNRTQICNANTHKTIREFFNDQIHHLKCTCKALQLNNTYFTTSSSSHTLVSLSDAGSGKFSMPVLIASAAGGILLLFILCAIVGFICYRRKKSKKRLQQASKVVYMPAPNSDNYQIYIEPIDNPPSLNTPSLPARCSPLVNSSDDTQYSVCEDTQGYLEPVVDSCRLKQKQASTVVCATANNSDNYPIYQEIIDYNTHPDCNQPPSLNPPSLPARCVPLVNSSDETQYSVCEDTQGYLEPVADSCRLKQNQDSTVVCATANNSDSYPTYQELIDYNTHPGCNQPPSLNPPSLPARCAPLGNSSDETQYSVCEDTQGYLEPVADSCRLKPNRPLSGQPIQSYGVPTEYAEADSVGTANTDGAYFEPADDEDKGYDTLGRNKASMEAKELKMAPLVAVPAKRTKDDRKTKSHYQFETDGNSIAEPEYFNVC